MRHADNGRHEQRQLCSGSRPQYTAVAALAGCRIARIQVCRSHKGITSQTADVPHVELGLQPLSSPKLTLCAVIFVPAATNAAPQTVSCMSGIPCGRMCAPLGGTCIHNQCYDSLGYPALCYAPMANTYSNAYTGGGSWWQPLFNPFFSFRPWQPIMQQPMQQPFMQPMVFPAMNDCGGRGPCPAGAFCDAAGVCREGET